MSGHRDFVDWRNIHRKGILCAHANSMDGAGEGPEGAADCELWAADNPEKLLNSSGENHVQNWLESGVHQAARSAIFQAAVGLLKPKVVQPVMVNFMSVGGTFAQCTMSTAERSCMMTCKWVHCTLCHTPAGQLPAACM